MDWFGLVWAVGLVWACLGWSRLVLAGVGWFELLWIGLGWFWVGLAGDWGQAGNGNATRNDTEGLRTTKNPGRRKRTQTTGTRTENWDSEEDTGRTGNGGTNRGIGSSR